MKRKERSGPYYRGLVQQEKRYSAVSPVVGVMLMLAVVIIIAAVVSGFAGGLIGQGSGQKAPTLSMDVQISNSGSWRASEISMDVTGVSEPIPTRDLKIITSWTTTVKDNYYAQGQDEYGYLDGKYQLIRAGTSIPSTGGVILNLPNGTIYRGGAVVLPGISNSYTGKTAVSVAPYGFGPGVSTAINNTVSETVGYYNPTSGVSYDSVGPKVPVFNWQNFPVTHFGNYSLEQGTVLMAEAGGRCIYFPALGGYPEDTTYNKGGYGSFTGNGMRAVPHPYTYASRSGVYVVYTGTKTIPSEIIQDGGQVDGMQALLGIGWENLRAGDIVNVKVVHTPTGKTIFDKDVVVSDS